MTPDSKKIAVKKSYDVPIIKLDKPEQLVYGVVMEPEVEDTQGDIISEEEIKKTAHDFMQSSRRMGISHKRELTANPVESYLAPLNFRLEGQDVKKGSWILGVKILDPQVWKDVESGLYHSFSVGGYANREPAE